MKNKILFCLVIISFSFQGYSADTLFIIFDAKAKNQQITKENFYCSHPEPRYDKICSISNYYKIKGLITKELNDCEYYELLFANVTVIDSAWHKTFMDTLVTRYKDLFTRPDGTLNPVWFNEDYLRRQRDPILLDSNYIDIKRKNVFFLSDLIGAESLTDLTTKMKANMNTTYIVDITNGISQKLYSYKVSWYNSPEE